MKLTKKEEANLIAVYKSYWDGYTKGDILNMAALLDDNYTQVGSADGEVFYNKKDAVQFLHDTIDQIAGKTQIRNSVIRLEYLESMILVNELFDGYVLIDGEWAYYAKFRASTLMQKLNGSWKIIHQHSSVPDMRTEEGENIATEKIAAENLQLRDAIKRRTIELEQKNRELEIEMTLERVRASAMAMQSSDELASLIITVFKELQKLDMVLTRCLLWIFNPDDNSGTAWMANSEDPDRADSYHVPYHDHPAYKSLLKGWKNRQKKWEYDLKGKVKDRWDEILLHGYFKSLPEKVKKAMKDPERVVLSGTFNRYGVIQTAGLHPLSDENQDILMRFSQVFEQNYTRFLDLQKAEDQAREAQIENALEKVRSSSLAMHKTEELQEVVAVLFEKLEELGFELDGAAFIGTPIEGSDDMNIWIGDSESHPTCFRISYYNAPPITDIWKAKESGEDFYSKIYSFKEKNRWFDYAFEHTDFKTLPEQSRKWILEQDCLTQSIAIAKKSMIGIHCHSEKLLTENEIDILKRFSRVFEQGYVRFLDLKKAEAQTREAQIENALEKVRSRSMGMQNSEELKEVVKVIFDQLAHLSINAEHAGIVVDYEPKKDWHFWVAETQDIPAKITVPYLDLVWDRQFTEAKKEGRNFFTIQLDFDEKNSFYKELLPHIQGLTKKAQDFYYSCPGLAISTVIQKDIGLYIENFSGTPYSGEENDILMRFAKVFQQTYTRFLDLQKAEAQARESQIEAALEKVRSRSLAMQKTDELHEVVAVVVEKLTELGVVLDANGVVLCTYFEDSKDVLHWISSPDFTFSGGYLLPYFDHIIFNDAWKSKEKGDAYFSKSYSVEDKNSFWAYAFEHSDYRHFPEDFKQWVLKNDKHSLSFAWSKNSAILIPSHTGVIPTEADQEILKRFAKVFEQAYTRFLDLQKVEAQAREAQIEASLERVRSRSIGMQKSEELREVIQIIHDQLIHLGFEIDAAGFTLDYHQNNDWNVWIANKSGSLPSLMFIPYIDHPQFNYYKHAKDKGLDFLANTLSFEEKNSIFTYMFEFMGDFPKAEKEELLSKPGLAISQAFLKNISLWIYNLDAIPYSEEDNRTLMRFAKVFEQTYVRFNDLKQAEAQAREAQIEAALERIRAKSLAMQSSRDLLEVSNVLREQMGMLGQRELESSIVHIYNSPETLEAWYTFRSTETVSPKTVMDKAVIPVDSCEYIRETIKKYHSNETEYTIVSQGDMLREWYLMLTKVAPDTVEYDEKGEIIVPDILYYHHSKFSGGALLLISNEKPSEESKELQRRAANVFNLAYQRFLDLQRAETQAKEAMKQASLDRVRGEIASMRSTEDLERITPLIWKELTALDVPFIRCGVFIMNEKQQHIESHLSTPEGKSLGVLNLPYDADKVGKNAVKFWRKGEIYKDHWTGGQFAKFMKKMVKLGRLDQPELYQGAASPPESLDLHFVPFKQGMLYVGNIVPLKGEEIQLVQSLAEAFSVAYARYEDFTQLEQAKNQIEKALGELKSTQTQLIHSEKMASLGELTAGIAHEIQNPLNFVNNFSEVSVDLIGELRAESLKLEAERDTELVEEILVDVITNLEKIHHHGQRASSIVKGMLEHSRSGDSKKESTDINVLADEYLRLAYHGLRAKNKSFNADFSTELDKSLPKIAVIPQDIGRVLLNLINNAFHAVSERSKQNANGYVPNVTVKTKKVNNHIEISVKDNGAGIPDQILDKIFQPFFTTKPTGQGTGLGLSLSYDIITKGHNGNLEVDTTEGVGTEFIVTLPIDSR